MRSAIRKELESATQSFLVKELREPYFDPNWHFHPHYQLFVVLEGTGTRFIGDSIKPFAAGDLVFLGPNLPHLWRSDAAYFQKDSGLETHGIVVYFKEDFLGKEFFQKQEMSQLNQLLQHAWQGMEWKGETRRQTEQKLKQLAAAPPDFGRVLQLLHLLNDLSHATEYNLIASVGYTNTVTPEEAHRIRLVHEYVLSHFQEEIRLNAVADLVGMTASAFCRYFKTRSNKTFSDFVAEVRIGHACKLLMENRLSVAQICYECGFGTLSNFNRQFRVITGNTPLNYRKVHQ
jgi:AraC-like DNA-binding protein